MKVVLVSCVCVVCVEEEERSYEDKQMNRVAAKGTNNQDL